MPIRVQNDLPVKEILEKENIFVMDENRAVHQDIRPIKIGLLNLMPLKEDTELQLLRSLSNTPLQVDIVFLAVKNHVSKNTSANHLNRFYENFENVKDQKFDGFIITGAPVEQMPFEEVDYWEELVEIMEWTKTHVTSTIHLCWGAQAALYYHYGINKVQLDKKLFGIFEHKVMNRKIPLVRGFDDVFYAPHSRHTDVPIEKLRADDRITILAESDEAGAFLSMAKDGRQIFVMGHPEYDRMTLDQEYKRDLSKGLPIDIPKNYYPDDNPDNRPLLTWRAQANNLYTNWLNYYVYQVTPYDLDGTPDLEAFTQFQKDSLEEDKEYVENFKWAFEKGCSWSNMGGVEGTLDDGLTKFKDNFNPTINEFIGEFDIPIYPFMYRLTQKAYKILKSKHM